MTSSIQQWLPVVRDAIVIVGVPSMGALILILHRMRVSVLKDQIEFLRATQYPNAVETITSLKEDAEARLDQLESELRAALDSGKAKSAEVDELRSKLADAAGDVVELAQRKRMLSKHSDAAAIRFFVKGLSVAELDDYFDSVLRSARDQAQKTYIRDYSAMSQEEVGQAIQEGAEEYARKWAIRKGVREEWESWFHNRRRTP